MNENNILFQSARVQPRDEIFFDFILKYLANIVLAIHQSGGSKGTTPDMRRRGPIFFTFKQAKMLGWRPRLRVSAFTSGKF